MTTSTRRIVQLAMFTLAAVTLAVAFSGIALAAPGGSDPVSPTPHVNPPVYTLPPGWEPVSPEGEPEDPTEPAPEPPAEPEPPTPPAPQQPKPQPTPTQPPSPTTTSAPGSQPFATPPATSTDIPAASQPANASAVRAAIGAGLVAVLLGGGWLATSLARVMRRERHS
ncbi:MAG: hypothetical protein GEU97_14065 [Actinophytocola sp.]|nr:hypothetical protein [Actinophytocola sp.]